MGRKESFYHGTKDDLDNETHILPGKETGKINEWGFTRPLNSVFVTNDPESAHWWGSQSRSEDTPTRVYKVKPEGLNESGTSAKRAKIIKRIR